MSLSFAFGLLVAIGDCWWLLVTVGGCWLAVAGCWWHKKNLDFGFENKAGL